MDGEAKSIAVLGAGVAGLATAKTLKQYGYDVIIYEVCSALGGVWANNYRSLCVLEPKWVYGYPDWPWPRETPLYPPASHVRDYLESYAEHFGIRDRIRLNARVVEATPTNDGRWRIVAESNGERDSAEYDYFVMAPGMFNLKKMPDWPGTETFEGELIHSSEFRDGEQVGGKNVVIVGFSRSAMDIAVDIVDEAESVTVLHRSIRWPVPEKILGLIRNHVLLFARWPTHFAPPWIRPGRAARFLHGPLRGGVNLFWKFFEVLLSTQFRLNQHNLVPDRPIKLDLFTNLYIAPPRFFGLVGDGAIGTRHSEIESFENDGVRLTNGELLPADLVLCATGWRHDYSFLAPDLLVQIYDADGMHLYRHMLHPALPGFAFVGGVQGINSATLYAMQATWLARCFKGEFALPSAEEQLAEIEALKAWNRSFVTERPNRAQILNLHQLPYLDDLMDDMGLEKRRKPLLADQFVPYRSMDYAAVTAGTNPS
jgi:cation diffusion facilitator CzcD-associated flavoprotein CzcO